MVQALLDLVREGDITPSSITTADVAVRAGVPIGSLYEYFEDLGAIADAAVDQLLHRHDELLEACARQKPSTPIELVDVLIDTYGRLYRDDTGYLPLRFSTLFQPYHRLWLSQSLESFIQRMIDSEHGVGSLAGGAASLKRMQLLFAVGDAVLQEVYRNGAEPDPEVLAEGRALLHLAMERLGSGASDQGSTDSETSNAR
jgi:AcrR family transcriptional regulator